MKCWGSSSSETASDSWDHYTNSSPTETNIDSDSNSYEFTITPNNHAESGSWTCKAIATDAASDTGNDTDTFTMNTRVGITLGASSCTASGNPGTNNVALTSCSANTVTHDGNVDLNVTVEGTVLTGQTDGSWTISVGNLEYNSTNTLPGTALTGSAVDILNDWSRGTSPTASTSDQYWWIDIPTPLKAQDYAGTITYTAAQA